MTLDEPYQAWTQAENDQQQKALIAREFVARWRADHEALAKYWPDSQPASNNPDAGTTADTGKEKL